MTVQDGPTDGRPYGPAAMFAAPSALYFRARFTAIPCSVPFRSVPFRPSSANEAAESDDLPYLGLVALRCAWLRYVASRSNGPRRLTLALDYITISLSIRFSSR